MPVSRAFHISANDPVSFLFKGEWYSIEYMYHILFIQSSVHEHLGCFHILHMYRYQGGKARWKELGDWD